MNLSIIIPAFNEERRLLATLDRIARFFGDERRNGEIQLREVIVVDDGSTDRTEATADEWRGELPLRVIRFPRNRGKGAALRAGVDAAEGDAILLYDADAATPIEEIDRLVPPLLTGEADIVIGSRTNREIGNVRMAWHRRFIGRVYHALCSGLLPGIQDAACGCKLFTAGAAKTLFNAQRIDRFAYDVEILSMALRRGYRIREIPVAWTAVAGSKLNLVTDGAEMLWSVIKLYARRWMKR